MAGAKQRSWAGWAARSFAHIDQCCRLRNMTRSAGRLANLYRDAWLAAARQPDGDGRNRLSSWSTTHHARRANRHGSKLAATHTRRRQRDWATLRAFGLARTGYGWVELLDISEVDRPAVLDALKTRFENASARVLRKRKIIGENRREMQNTVLRIGDSLKGERPDGRRTNGRGQRRTARGRYASAWPEHVPREVPPDEIDEAERDIREREQAQPPDDAPRDEEKPQGNVDKTLHPPRPPTVRPRALSPEPDSSPGGWGEKYPRHGIFAGLEHLPPTEWLAAVSEREREQDARDRIGPAQTAVVAETRPTLADGAFWHRHLARYVPEFDVGVLKRARVSRKSLVAAVAFVRANARKTERNRAGRILRLAMCMDRGFITPRASELASKMGGKYDAEGP